MIILQAPHELIQTTTLLPSPQFSDIQNNTSTVSVKKTINGTTYTYVKSRERKKLVYSFILDRQKAFELQAFIESYIVANIRLTNHKDEIWLVNLTNDPVDFVAKARREIIQVGLEFEGVKISG